MNPHPPSAKTPPARRPQRGFTLIELLVVVSIIAILIGILLPVLSHVRGTAEKVTCSSALRQLGIVIQAYTIDNKELYPVARYMPEPFVSTRTDPPLTEVLDGYLDADAADGNNVYRCPDDDQVFALAGISYDYDFTFGGESIEDIMQRRPFRRLDGDTSKVAIMRDFDNGEFTLISGETINVPMRHVGRNVLFLDGHVGRLDF